MKPDDSRITTIEVLYFARLREAFGRDREQVALPRRASVAALTSWLTATRRGLGARIGAGKPVRIAVNQDMADAETPVETGDEVAFFPPVTGG